MHRSTRLRDLAFALGIVAAGGMVGTRPCSAVWQQVGGPEPPMVAAIADDGSGLLFLGTDEADAGDLYRSEDGIHWSNLRLPSGGALRIEEHLGKLFLGTYLSGLFYSVDHGDSWQQVGSLGNATIHDFASSGGTMFAVPEAFLGSTLLRSTDGGLSWSGVAGLPQVQVETLDSFGSVLLAGTDGSGILRSTDGGGSWGNGNAGLPGAAIVPVLAGDGSAIYAGVRVQGNAAAFGVYRSTDGGSSWTKASVDLPGSNLADFGALGFHGGELFAGLIATAPIAGVYRSTDGGAHWLAASNGLPDGAAVRALCSTGSFLLAGTDAGAFRTTDAGAHWTESDEGTAAIRGVSSVLSEEDGIFLGLTTNGGIGRGVWRTTDHGASWTGDPREPAQSSEANGIVRLGSDLFVAVTGGTRGVFRSTDEGATWIPSSPELPPTNLLRALHVHDGVLLAGAWEALYRSTDAGASWSAVPGMTNVSCFTSVGGTIFAGHYGTGVSVSTDGGESWTPANGGLATSEMKIENALATFEGTAWLATNGAGVRRWNGTAWVSTGLANGFVNALLPVGGALVAAQALGDPILFTTDGGQSWTPFAEGYAGEEPYELAADSSVLYAGSRGHGIWTRPLSELPQPASAGDPNAVDGARGRDGALAGLPNPFLGGTRIRFRVPEAGEMSLRVYDPAGREVGRLAEGYASAGEHEVHFDARDLPAGVYFARLREAGGATTELRLLLLR